MRTRPSSRSRFNGTTAAASRRRCSSRSRRLSRRSAMKHNARIRHVSTIAAQRGLTLVELMIAMLLGLLLTAGMIQVFMGNRVTYAFNENLSRIQEKSRFALQHIAEVGRTGGYTGCIANAGETKHPRASSDFRDGITPANRGLQTRGIAPAEH